MGRSGAEGAAPRRFLIGFTFCNEMGVRSFCFTKKGGPGGLCSLCDTNGGRGGGRGGRALLFRVRWQGVQGGGSQGEVAGPINIDASPSGKDTENP